MGELQLNPGEQILGSWFCYTGEQGVNTAKTTGKLYVTDSGVYFCSSLDLAQGAASQMRTFGQPFEYSKDDTLIPFADIRAVKILRKWFILKSLEVTLSSGAKVAFHFGAMSPGKAAKAICGRIGCLVEQG